MLFASILLPVLLALVTQKAHALPDLADRREQARTHFEEGMTYWKAGNREAALAAFEASAERTGYAAPSAFHPRKGAPGLKGAREDFRTVLLGEPDSAEAHYFVGNLFSDDHQWREAIKEYQGAILLNPQHSSAHFNLANEWARSHNWESAAAHYRVAADLAPSDPDTHNLLVTVLLEKGSTADLQNALLAAQVGVKSVPDNPDVHFYLGRVWLRLARRDEAAKEFREFLRLEPPATGIRSRTNYVNRLLDEMAPYLSP